MFHITDVSSMSSTLVETVSIDYEDFNDSFLTCGTCLCMYDGEEHNPKLLPCSHTVCRSCLQRILEAQSRDNTTLRCPICRETITIPRGGVGAFPPSFIVNQLLDLMARQRRDIIPKCTRHPHQELMFCETCDRVFCVDCTGGSHNGRGASAHTVIPFSIAIKRMSEILLYKAGLCMRNLNAAADIVSQEIQRLDASSEKCVEGVTQVFQDVMELVEMRQQDVTRMVNAIGQEKKKVLQEQLNIIEGEKTKVQADCQGLQQQVEVRHITKKISDLNEKLDVSSTLAEPRENAFMKFEYKHNSALADLVNTLSVFGSIKISMTFPALCSAVVEKPVTHLQATVTVTTVDYRGNPRTSGGDPLVSEVSNEKGEPLPANVEDHDNGTYTITFTPLNAGIHKLSITIFGRAIRESPFVLNVSEHNNPIAKYGFRGSGRLEFIQPINIVVGGDGNLYILDTGNSRVQVLDTRGHYVKQLAGVGLEQHSGTGMALTPINTLVIINWRTKHVTELNLQGQVVKKFGCAEFVEPISIAVNRSGEVIVADNGVGALFVFDAAGQLMRKIGSKGDKPGQFKLIQSIYCSPLNDDILVTDNRLQIFNKTGQYLGNVPSGTGAKGQFGGVTIDRHGNILATRSEKGQSCVQVYNNSRKWLFSIDSFEDKLKRPSGLVTLSGGHVIVVDLGNDCLKKFRYM